MTSKHAHLYTYIIAGSDDPSAGKMSRTVPPSKGIQGIGWLVFVLELYHPLVASRTSSEISALVSLTILSVDNFVLSSNGPNTPSIEGLWLLPNDSVLLAPYAHTHVTALRAKMLTIAN